MVNNRRLIVDVSLLVLFTVISSNFACKCNVSGRDNPEFLCDFDYGVLTFEYEKNCGSSVLHGEVIGERIVGSNASVQEHERIYTVKVIEMYRGQEYNSSNVELHTSYYGPACGITLELHKSYVIAGSFSAGQLRAYSCGWNVQWGSIMDSFKKYFPKLKDCSESSHLYAATSTLLLTLLLIIHFT